MFQTRSAQSLRRLFAGYHEPSPISKQQSQQLLDGLKASFRSQLDREYGRILNAPASASPTSVAESNHPQHLRHSAATQHLKSILSNPLFSYDTNVPASFPSAPAAVKRDPMDVFDHAVAKGMMTIKAATGCMISKRNQVTAAESTENLASSDTALRVVRWLRSSDLGTTLTCLDNQPFVRALAPFLVAEGMEPVAWEWMDKTVNDTAAAFEDDQRVRRASFLLAQLVRIKSQPQYGNLDAAISTILEAEQRFQKSPLLPQLLVLPWRSVSWLSTVESYSRAAPSEKLFDAHMATAGLLPRAFPVETAHLHLHHPTQPDHAPALQFFQNKKMLRKLVHSVSPEKISMAKVKGMSIIPWIAFLGHDTVNHLTQSGRSQEAQGVTELLQSELANLFTDTLDPV